MKQIRIALLNKLYPKIFKSPLSTMPTEQDPIKHDMWLKFIGSTNAIYRILK